MVRRPGAAGPRTSGFCARERNPVQCYGVLYLLMPTILVQDQETAPLVLEV